MKLVLGISGALSVLLSAAVAPATDFLAARAGFTAAAAPGGARYASSAGASFEANIVPDTIGVRLGGDAVFGGWFQSGSGNTLGVRPEIAFFPGADDPSLRPYGTLRWQLAALGMRGASAHLVEALELGPELEWRYAKGNGLRLRVGAFFAVGRDPSGELRWPGGGSLAFTIEYGKPTLQAPVVPKECIELPTRPCPPASP